MLLFFIAFGACAAGAVSGIGGGVLLKPLLDALTDFDSAKISTLSAFTVFAMALAAGGSHLRAGTSLDRPMVLRLSLGAAVGGVAGAEVLGWVSVALGRDETLKLVQNAALLALLAVVLIYIDFFQRRIRYRIESSAVTILCGVALGTVSAFLGIGGGPVNLAALCLLFSLELREAAACSVVIILFSQGTKLLTLLLTGRLTGENLPVLLWLIPGALLGGLLGAAAGRRLPKQWLLGVYNAVMVAVGCVCVWNLIRWQAA